MSHEMTDMHLRNAYGGESMAHMRYNIWGSIAHNEGFPNVARLFNAISYAEQVHATNHFNVLGSEKGDYTANSGAVFGAGSTSQNLQGGIDGEVFEIEEMYPVYLESAAFQNEKGAKRSFHYSLCAEKIHAEMFRNAKESVDKGDDITLGPVRICDVCGHTTEGDVPDKCPVCGARADKFTSFE